MILTYALVCIIFLPFLLLVLLIGKFLLLWNRVQKTKESQKLKSEHSSNITVGFFHPYCNAGGGGERVLWIAIRCLQNRYPGLHCVIYTGDNVPGDEIVTNAESRFGISLPRPVDFVFLKKRKWVEAEMYPYFTLLGQSLGSMILGIEALTNFVPDIYIDTMGYAFTLPLFKWIGGCRTACYVHYPTISLDMLQKVSSRVLSHNNRAFIANSSLVSGFKGVYYQIFAVLYGLMGRCSEIIMVNSSWTKEHILSLWKRPLKTFLVYPPCNVQEFESIPLLDKPLSEPKKILSIAQFRPEKDHRLQIRAFQKLLQLISGGGDKNVYLILMGSCRNSEDETRVAELKKLCQELEVENQVKFRLNVSFSELKKEMSESVIGLHTMWNEHFGIGVVESMAAGLLMIAHDSGGPKMDIVVDFDGKKTGFLASDDDSFAHAMENALNMSPQESLDVRKNAKRAANRFSEEIFEERFLDCIQILIR